MQCAWRSLTLISLRVASSITLCSLATHKPAKAQINPDGTLGTESSRVTVNVNNKGITYTHIDGGAVRQTSLFHSFEEFNIGAGQAAYFSNPSGIANIFSRVTGTKASDIQGILGVLGNANLFLINPKGMIFGSGARLDVNGSFIGTTASGVVFNNNFTFSSTNPEAPPLLTINVPIGLQFGANPGMILVQGNGQGLRRFNSPVIDTTFGLRVPENQTLALVGGDIALEGATLKTAGGRIELGSVAGSSLVSLVPIAKGWALGYQGVSAYGDINLLRQAAVDASSLGGGEIQVRGRRVSLTGGSQIEASTLGARTPGSLEVTASESVEAIGTSADGNFFSGILAGVYPGANGNGGKLEISTKRLSIQGGGQVGTATWDGGSAGNLNVIASESVEAIGTSPDGFSPSGLFVGVLPRAKGNGGMLAISTKRLSVQGGAIVASSTFGEGAAGNLNVIASESVEVTGRSSADRYVSRLAAQTFGTGNGSNLTIQTGQLTVRDGAKLTVGGGEQFMGMTGSGNAGNLEAQADSIFLDKGATLQANTQAGKGNITVRSLLLVLRRGSNITTNATGSNNMGGNITIDTDNLVAVPKENSDITANSEDFRGGRIRINASGIFGIKFRPGVTKLSDITASGRDNSLNGTVITNILAVEPSRGLNTLPTKLADPTSQIDQSCSTGGRYRNNKFTITGRGGLPPSPNDLLTSDQVLDDFGTLATENHSESKPVETTLPTTPPKQLIEAQGWIVDDKGVVILVASAPTVTPHSPALTSAECHISSIRHKSR